MSATQGYFVAGSSWLHRRHPLTKLLALALVLLAAFLLPPLVLPVMAVVLFVAAWSAGLLRRLIGAMRIPALLLTSILVVNALFFPGATDRLLVVGPFAVTREGLTFGLISAGRLLVVFLASVLFLFSTLADDLLESLIERGASHRIAFVVLSAVQMVPRMQARAGIDPGGAAGPRADHQRVGHPPGARPRAAHRPGAAGVAHRRARADVRARGARVRGATRPDGVSTGRRPGGGPAHPLAADRRVCRGRGRSP